MFFSLQSFGHALNTPTVPPIARAGHLTADGRRADVDLIVLDRDNPGPSTGVDNNDDWLDIPGNDYEDVATARPNTTRKRKQKWYATTDDPLRHWVSNYRDEYLRVLMTREGKMGMGDECPCGDVVKYRCRDCHGGQMFCCGCIVETHRLSPLCRIEVWTGSFFEGRELHRLGLRVQLGHPDNTPCSLAQPGREKIVVIAHNGFHHVAVDFCQCRRSGSQPRWEQLLSFGWYPSTPDHPQSAITISALKLFHAISLQGKTTVYHFFNALSRITDNTGSKQFKRRYQLALRVVRQWRNLRVLKRGGIGNDPDRRASQTRAGELGVDCLACPKPGVNLPSEWEQTPPEKRFLYTIFLAIDACFRLKRKKISSWAADLSLQDGWAYFVPSAGYMAWVKTLGDQKEMSTCTGLAVLDHANTKYAQGYAATGCGMITCGRHEIVAKNGVGDLQAGEKYGNMDYIVASAWQHFLLLLFILLSYDIMCQWYKNLRERLSKLPPGLRLNLVLYFIKYVIPKLHILGHLRKCQESFSLSYTLGAAQADMEGIERIWSSSGQMGVSTREMGLGSRQDTLDDFWHFWNWNKVVGMGDTLCKHLIKAVDELARQKVGLEEFSAAQKDDVPTWKKAADDFEHGVSLVNPYELPASGLTMREIELELAREEQERERTSATAHDSAEGTMTEYLMFGLEIEGQQRELRADLLANRAPSTKELTDFVARRTRISWQIKKLRMLQRKFSPGALQKVATAVDADVPEAERVPLFLPSALSPAESLPPLSLDGLAAAEARLHNSQCSEHLDTVHHGLIVKKRLQTYQSQNSRHQQQNTRARTIVDAQQKTVDLAAATYREARAARMGLDHIAGPSGWRALEKADVRLPEDEEEAKKRKQRAMKSKRKEAAQVNESGEAVGKTSGAIGEEMHGAMKVEWCKAYARVKGWREEVLLLQEEMVRCLLTLEWQATRWSERAAESHYRSSIVYGAQHREGAMVFAVRQATLRRRLANRFRHLWAPLSDRIQEREGTASSASSGVDMEHETFGGAAEGSGDEVSVDEGGGASRGGEQEEERGEPPEEGKDLSSEEVEMRRAEMDTLLAVQSNSLSKYDEI
ncbi:hypothetical protein K438DRAFT_1961156 [Mycena galopus ATCC 62051]|nr:hypothetical protein K438DRAFT_1961156 [Mycena galopus ATCC 62051]